MSAQLRNAEQQGKKDAEEGRIQKAVRQAKGFLMQQLLEYEKDKDGVLSDLDPSATQADILKRLIGEDNFADLIHSTRILDPVQLADDPDPDFLSLKKLRSLKTTTCRLPSAKKVMIMSLVKNERKGPKARQAVSSRKNQAGPKVPRRRSVTVSHHHLSTTSLLQCQMKM